MPIVAAVICGILGFVATAIIVPSDFNYADAPEERQQQRLENIARGFEFGFKATSAGMAEIERIRANAETDTVSVDIRFTKKEIELAPASAIADYRRDVYTNACGFLAKKSVLSEGVTLRLRMLKPSGSMLTNFTINEDGCRPYLKKA